MFKLEKSLKVVKLSFIVNFFLFLTTPAFSGVVENGLSKVSFEDKCSMKEFVKLNFLWHQIANVIFCDNRPCCLASGFVQPSDAFIGCGLWIKGFEAFKKNEWLFPHPNFLFISRAQKDPDGCQTVDLFIINKRALRKCFDKYLFVFKEILGDQCTFDWFLTKLQEKNDVTQVIQGNQMLLGILLGYGYESSKAFQKHSEKRLDSFLISSEVYCGNYSKMPTECPFFPIAIMGNPNSKEMLNLLSSYEKEIEVIWNEYQKKDPLLFFLEGICEERMNPLEGTFRCSSNLLSDFSFQVFFKPFSVTYP